MTSLTRRTVAAIATGTVVLTVGAGIAVASPPAVATVPATDAPPSAVEDFSYPGADRILAEQGIKLISGNGRITLAECGSTPGQLEVWARSKPKFCFQVTGKGGYLSLDLPRVYGIKGNGYTTQVDVTVDSQKTSVDIAKDTWVPVGETADPEGRDHALVEIRSVQ